MLLAPVSGQLPFDGGFENGRFVTLEVGLDALEVCDCFVEAGELLFDLRDNGLLLSQWRYRYFILKELGGFDTVDRSPLLRASVKNVLAEGA
jgi:hypothetical protein